MVSFILFQFRSSSLQNPWSDSLNVPAYPLQTRSSFTFFFLSFFTVITMLRLAAMLNSKPKVKVSKGQVYTD